MTQSFVAHADTSCGWRSFILARALRIMPGLIACTVVVAVACGFASTLSGFEYWTSQETWRCLASNVVLLHYNALPGVFLSNPAGAGINGSIWTLRLEVGMYAATFLLGLLGAWKSRIN